MDFGGDYNMFSGNIEVFKNFSKLFLWLSRGIDFSSVEEVDSIFKGNFYYFFVFFIGLGSIVDHVSEGDGWDL